MHVDGFTSRGSTGYHLSNWWLFLTLSHFSFSFCFSFLLSFSVLSFFSAVLCLGLRGKARHKALSLRDPYGTKLAFWAFCIYARHADNEAFIRVASISELKQQGWGMESGKAVTDTACVCLCVCVCVCVCVRSLTTSCPCMYVYQRGVKWMLLPLPPQSSNQSLPIQSLCSETVFLYHMV